MKTIRAPHSYSKYLPWLVWTIAALFYGYEFCLQASIGVMVPDLMRDFQVTAGALGMLSSLYFYAYAGMQIPAGLLFDYLGPRRLLSFAIITCSLGAFCFAMSHSFTIAAIGRMLIGLGSAFAALGCMTLAANWFAPRQFSILTGLLLTMGMSGAIMGGKPLAGLVLELGWRQTLLEFALLGIGLSLLLWLVVRDHPTQETLRRQAEPTLPLIPALLKVLKNKNNWMTSLYAGLMFAPTMAIADLWGVPFLMTQYSIGRPEAAELNSLIFLGWVVGSPLLGFISDHTGRRKPVLYTGSIFTLVCLSGLLYIPQSLFSAGILLFGFGFFSSGFLPAFSMMREHNPRHIRSTALGFMNCLNMIGGAILQQLIGYLLDLRWQGALVDGIRSYQTENYIYALSTVTAVVVIAIALLPFVKESYGRDIDEAGC